MTTATLFDQLADRTDRLGLNAPRTGTIAPTDRQLLDAWAERGVPADLPTVDYACTLLAELWATLQRVESERDRLYQQIGAMR